MRRSCGTNSMHFSRKSSNMGKKESKNRHISRPLSMIEVALRQLRWTLDCHSQSSRLQRRSGTIQKRLLIKWMPKYAKGKQMLTGPKLTKAWFKGYQRGKTVVWRSRWQRESNWNQIITKLKEKMSRLILIRQIWSLRLQMISMTRIIGKIRFYHTASVSWTTSACRESSYACSCWSRFWLRYRWCCTTQLAGCNISTKTFHWKFLHHLAIWASPSRFALKSCLRGTAVWRARSNWTASTRLKSQTSLMLVCSSP